MNGQYGFFDLSNRHEQLSSQGDPLERLNSVVDWKIFLPLINRAFYKARKSSAGRKPFNHYYKGFTICQMLRLNIKLKIA